MSENVTTIQSYEDHTQEYIDGTPQEVSGTVKDWIDTSLALIPEQGEILELGSAFGRDAAYMEERGFIVHRTDVVQGFVKLLRSQGHQARSLNALTGELGSPYDMVFANAVLLHFTPEETGRVVQKVHKSLSPNGVFAFTLKQGLGEEISVEKLGAPRYFNYWQPDALVDVIEGADFEVVQLNDADSSNRTDVTWLHAIARKK